MLPIDFFHTMEVNGAYQLFGYRQSSKHHLFALQKRKIHTGLEQLEGELMIFGELSL